MSLKLPSKNRRIQLSDGDIINHRRFMFTRGEREQNNFFLLALSINIVESLI